MQLIPLLSFLLEMLVKSSAVLALAWLASRLFRTASAANRCIIWCAAFIILLALPVTRVFQPKWTLPLDHRAPAANADLVVKIPLTAQPLAPQSEQANPAQTATAFSIPWTQIALAAWLAGASALLLRRMVVGWRVARLAQRGVTFEKPYAVRLPVPLKSAAECPVPMLVGWWKPCVLLPEGAASWSDARLAAALAHELGHWQRRDAWWRLLADVTRALYWPNPLAWLAARELRLAQEQACDDLALGSGVAAADYAELLVDVVRGLGERDFSARHALAMAQPSTLETRICAIVDDTRSRTPRSLRALLGGAAAVALVLAASSAAQLVAEEKTAEPTKKTDNPQAAEKKERTQILIESKFIQISSDTRTIGKFELPEKPSLAGDVIGVFEGDGGREAIEVLLKAKGIDVLSAPMVMTNSGQRAVIEIIREFRYPESFEKDPKNPERWVGKDFVTRNTGVTLEVEPSVSHPTVDAIELRLEPKIVEVLGWINLNTDEAMETKERKTASLIEHLQTPPVLTNAPKNYRAKPVFSERSIKSDLTLKSGQTVVLELSTAKNEHSKLPATSKTERVLVFITPKIVQPTGEITITADEQNLDSKTGKMTAKGNVQIETESGTITADKVVFKSRAPVPTPDAEKTTLVFPKIDFKEASLTDALEFIRIKSRELDPAKKGVNIVLHPDAAKAAGKTRLSLELNDVPLIEVVKYVTSLANLRYQIEGDTITLRLPEPTPAK